MRLNKNAHCFAVEPSRLTLRFRCKHLRFAIASRRSFRLPPGTPKNNRNRGCFCIRGSPCVLIKTHTALQSNPPAGASLSMQASSLRYFVALLLPTPPGYTKKQPQPRLFLYTEGEESVRLNKNAHCFAVEPSRLSATCRRHTSRRRYIAFARGKNIASSLLYGALPGDCHATLAMTFFYPQRALYFCFFAKEKPSEIRTVFCCLDLLFFVDQCFVGFIVFC